MTMLLHFDWRDFYTISVANMPFLSVTTFSDPYYILQYIVYEVLIRKVTWLWKTYRKRKPLTGTISSPTVLSLIAPYPPYPFIIDVNTTGRMRGFTWKKHYRLSHYYSWISILSMNKMKNRMCVCHVLVHSHQGKQNYLKFSLSLCARRFLIEK